MPEIYNSVFFVSLLDPWFYVLLFLVLLGVGQVLRALDWLLTR